MTLSESDYNRFLQFRKVIAHVAYGGSTANTGIWPIMNQIKYEHTGTWSRSDCNECKVALFREFEVALTEYEKNNGKET